MPEKQKTRNWKDPKTVIAAVSVTMLVTIWNTFATHDRGKVGDTDSIVSTVSTPSAAPEVPADNICPTPTVMRDRGAKCMTVSSTRSS